ncbi:MAG: GNAT family N-acetyltransferase [Saprospiraceae bacterium]|nr:GNAT family N-acetyltransferase [Saprospiraceae bacterium]
MSYTLRIATLSDINFIAKVIIEAEKSGSDKIGIATVFNLTESELQNYLVEILDEEIDGCEFSFSSFVIAEFNGQPVAAFGGWIENENENNQPSAILKSNLIGFVFPKEKLLALKKNQEIIKDILIDREPHTHQLEYAYVDEEHRGHGLTNRIINQLLEIAKKKNPNLKKSQVQVYANNSSAIKVYERAGYYEIDRKESNHSLILDYLPWNVKLVLEKKL